MLSRLLRSSGLRALATFAVLLALASTPAFAQSSRTASQIAQPGDAPPAPQQAFTISETPGSYLPSATPSSSKRVLGGLIGDPSFEATEAPFGDNPSWDGVLTAGAGLSPFCNPDCLTGAPELARTGDFFVIFGFGNVGTDFIEQTVTVPEAGDYELEFYFSGGLSGDGDEIVESSGVFSAFVDGTQVYELTAEEAPPYSTAAFNRVVVPVSFAAAGEATIRIELDVPSTGEDVYQVVIDDVSLAPPPPPPVGQLLDDPSFEATPGPFGDNPSWDGVLTVQDGLTPFCNPDCLTGAPELARTGDFFVIFGFGNVGTDFIEQTVTVPEAGDYNLQFYLRGGLADNNGNGTAEAEGTFSAIVDGTPVYTLTAEEALPFDADYSRIDVPVSFAAPGAATVRLELDVVGGTGEDVFQVTLDDVTLGPPVEVDPVLNAGEVATEILDDGYFGANAGNGLGVIFDGSNGLFEGQFLAGLSATTVYGQPYEAGEWTTTQEIANIDPPEGFDEAVETTFESSDGALQVTLRAFAREGDAAVFLEYEILNQSGGDVTDVYAGPFSDWDVGAFASNRSGFDTATNLLYVFDDSDGSTNYFGTVALFSNAAPVAGIGREATAAYDDATLYSFLSTISPEPADVGDRRTILGTGPWTISDGGTALARFAIVAGADLDDITEAAGDVQAAFPSAAIIDTGVIQTEVIGGGLWGADADDDAEVGFVFDGTNGLFEGHFLVSTEPDEVYGIPYLASGGNGWVATSGPAAATPPTGFDQAFASTFDSDDGTLSVTELVYANTGDPYVYYAYTIDNLTDDLLEEVYVGLFSDWDIGDFSNNLTEFSGDLSLLYTLNPAGRLPYFGVAAANSNELPVSGYTGDADPSANEVELYNGLIEFNSLSSALDDRRNIIASGPYEIEEAESATVLFIATGGGDLTEIETNAALAQGINPATESTEIGTYALHGAFPNPFAARTTLGYELPAAEQVRLEVYDVLGRRVATLVNDVQQAGYQSVELDGSTLPSGTYFYRLTAGTVQLTERFTLVR